MTPAASMPSPSLIQRLRWAVMDTLVITIRDLNHWRRNPVMVLIGLLFPLLIVLQMGYVFGGAITIPGDGNYREFLMPGMFALTMLFGLEATFTAVATDSARGVTDRFRSMPMAPSAIVAGRSVADMLFSALGLAVMLASGLLVGWRFRGGIGDALLAVGLLLLLRIAMLWVGIYLALVLKKAESVVALQILVWPVGFLSSAFVAPETMPRAVQVFSEWNPVSATVDATRELFGNPGAGGDSWIAQNALLMAVVWPLLIILIFAPLAIRRYQSLSR